MGDKTNLRSLAERATQPGPWTVSHSRIMCRSTVCDANGFFVVDVENDKEHAAYIAAASPDVVLALLDEVERLRDAADRERRHPLAPDRCPACDWTNVNLMNYGSPGSATWMCHGCAARAINQLAAMTAARDEALLDARRYWRLRVIGCAPSTAPQLKNGTVLTFTSLDKFVDEDIENQPSRGESELRKVGGTP
jgi:hypothetical protein